MEAGQDRGECRPAREGYRGELVLSDAPRNLAGGPTGVCSVHFRSRGRPGERDVHDTGGLSRGVLRATVIPRGGDRRRMAGEPLHHRDIGPPFQCGGHERAAKVMRRASLDGRGPGAAL